jgi:hypothetical protein
LFLALNLFFSKPFTPSFLPLLRLSFYQEIFNIVHFAQTLGLALGVALVSASANPIPNPAPDLKNPVALQKRASCTFTAASAVSKSKKDRATIVLDNIAAPSGTTLDLTDLESGTHAIICSPYVIELLLLPASTFSTPPSKSSQ